MKLQDIFENVDVEDILRRIRNNPASAEPYVMAMRAVLRGEKSPELSIIIKHAVASKHYEAFADFIARAPDKIFKEYLPLIKGPVKEYLEKHHLAKIKMKKLSRSRKEKDDDEKFDTFVFVGAPKFVEKPDGSYSKELDIESLNKIDKYNVDDLSIIPILRVRARTREGGNVYMIRLPAGYIKDKNTHHLEPWLVKLIDEKKQKI
jgi:hypothetical protein